jgi:AcrR family transcriptional regulator
MPPVKPRPRDRRDRAQQTRGKILRAADAEFRTNGYFATPMTAIAARAGVAVQTVYFVFHTKAELLSEAFDAAVLGEEPPTAPEQTEWFQGLATAPDAHAALAAFVAGTAEILARAAPLAEVVRAAAPSDPDVARVHEHHERLRIDGYHRAIELLDAREALRADIDVDQATDVLLTLAGPPIYVTFLSDRQWSHNRFVTWTAATLTELLLTPRT